MKKVDLKKQGAFFQVVEKQFAGNQIYEYGATAIHKYFEFGGRREIILPEAPFLVDLFKDIHNGSGFIFSEISRYLDDVFRPLDRIVGVPVFAVVKGDPRQGIDQCHCSKEISKIAVEYPVEFV